MSEGTEQNSYPNASELEQLCTFVDETDAWINETLTTLGWSRERISQATELVQCPVNCGHSVPQQSLGKHVEYCSLATKGYSKSEIDAEPSSKFFYERTPLVVSIDLDDATLTNILQTTGAPLPRELPATMARANTALTPAMRRRIYEYCVEVARSTNASSSRIADEDLNLLEDTRPDKPLTKLEMMAKMRDMKRRRQSYRGKSTHTAKKNYSEVMRDVLSNQMELLTNLWAEESRELEKKKKHDARERQDEDLKTDQHRRHSRSRSRKPSTDRRRRSRSRESSRHSQHRDDPGGSERERSEREQSSQPKRKHSRSRSRSRSHRKKHKRDEHRSRQKDLDMMESDDAVTDSAAVK